MGKRNKSRSKAKPEDEVQFQDSDEETSAWVQSLGPSVVSAVRAADIDDDSRAPPTKLKLPPVKRPSKAIAAAMAGADPGSKGGKKGSGAMNALATRGLDSDSDSDDVDSDDSRDSRRSRGTDDGSEGSEDGFGMDSDDESDEGDWDMLDGSNAQGEEGGTSREGDAMQSATKKQRTSTHSFAGAFTAAMTKAVSSSRPVVLSVNRAGERALEAEKLSYAASKLAAAKRKEAKLRSWVPQVRAFRGVVPERELMKVGTRGVVTLFNAIRTAQKSASEEAGLVAGKNGKKKAAVALTGKRKAGAANALVTATGTGGLGKSVDPTLFASLLSAGASGGKSSTSAGKKTVTSESGGSETPGWAALRSDYLTGQRKAKDWDREEVAAPTTNTVNDMSDSE